MKQFPPSLLYPLIAAALLCVARPAFAQGDSVASRPVNHVFLELGSSSGLGSIGYECLITRSLSARIGVGWLPTESYWIVPAISYLYGPGAHKAELTAGAVSITSISNIETWHTYMSSLGLHYRYQPGDGGIVWRIGCSYFWYSAREPELNMMDDRLRWFPGASIGYLF